ncbi:MAG: glutaredoxin family protein [Rubrivivax sp.]
MKPRRAALSRVVRLIALLLGLAASPGVNAAPAEIAPPASAAHSRAALEVFVREGCPHCADAKVFLAKLARERPGLRIVLRPIDQDPQTLDELMQSTPDKP